MQPIKRIAILGAGAMGAYFAASFYANPSFTTSLIADGARALKLQKDGLWVNDKQLMIPVTIPDEGGEPFDLIIVALKHHQLAPALSTLHPIVGENTLFLSVMNGLESESIIAKEFGWNRVLYAISVGIDAVREGNRITFTKPGRHIFGEAENHFLNPRVLRVQQAFTEAGIQFETPIDMLRMLWWKFMINCGCQSSLSSFTSPLWHFSYQSRCPCVNGGINAGSRASCSSLWH